MGAIFKERRCRDHSYLFLRGFVGLLCRRVNAALGGRQTGKLGPEPLDTIERHSEKVPRTSLVKVFETKNKPTAAGDAASATSNSAPPIFSGGYRASGSVGAPRGQGRSQCGREHLVPVGRPCRSPLNLLAGRGRAAGLPGRVGQACPGGDHSPRLRSGSLEVMEAT